MPIGAGIGAAVGTIGGSLLGASAQKKAAKQASNAETQAAQMNIDAAKEFRAENQANFQPNLQSGFRANALIDSFLYGPQPDNYYTGAPAAGTGVQTNPVAAQTPVPQQAPSATFAPANTFGGFAGALQQGALNFRDRNDLAVPVTGPLAGRIPGTFPTGGAGGGATPLPAQQGAQTPGTVTAQPQQNPLSPQSGFSAFVNSPYYQFGQNEGMRALNHGLASRGMLESGDAMKSAIRFGQDYGYSQGLMPYLGLAENQTNRGVQSAGGIAGVGLNAMNTIANSNTASGNAIANAALARGSANSNMYAGIGSALGGFAGSMFGGGGSSYNVGTHFNPSNPGVGF
jgi:hypothetical protein